MRSVGCRRSDATANCPPPQSAAAPTLPGSLFLMTWQVREHDHECYENGNRPQGSSRTFLEGTCTLQTYMTVSPIT